MTTELLVEEVKTSPEAEREAEPGLETESDSKAEVEQEAEDAGIEPASGPEGYLGSYRLIKETLLPWWYSHFKMAYNAAFPGHF